MCIIFTDYGLLTLLDELDPLDLEDEVLVDLTLLEELELLVGVNDLILLLELLGEKLLVDLVLEDGVKDLELLRLVLAGAVLLLLDVLALRVLVEDGLTDLEVDEALVLELDLASFLTATFDLLLVVVFVRSTLVGLTEFNLDEELVVLAASNLLLFTLLLFCAENLFTAYGGQ